MQLSFLQKYSPKKIDDFIYSDNFINIIKQLINYDSLNVLFIGTMDNGKTILLNTIVKEYFNVEKLSHCKDNILYINNAKEQGIQYYRNEVKTFCQNYSTIKNKKKVIIIDDFDLINEQSQQVFRNFIDNYKHNVHFIASCTNIQKIIESIQSRLFLMKMDKINNDMLNKICDKIIKLENINITKEAQDFLINISNLSLRIMINYLEKFKLMNKKITIDLTYELCTNIDYRLFDKYLQHIKNKDPIDKPIMIMIQFYKDGYSVMDILDSLFNYVKLSSLLSEEEKYKVIPYICEYIYIFHEIHENEIELALITNNLYKLL